MSNFKLLFFLNGGAARHLLVVRACLCIDDDVIIKATNYHKFHAESKMKNLTKDFIFSNPLKIKNNKMCR